MRVTDSKWCALRDKAVILLSPVHEEPSSWRWPSERGNHCWLLCVIGVASVAVHSLHSLAPVPGHVEEAC